MRPVSSVKTSLLKSSQSTSLQRVALNARLAFIAPKTPQLRHHAQQECFVGLKEVSALMIAHSVLLTLLMIRLGSKVALFAEEARHGCLITVFSPVDASATIVSGADQTTSASANLVSRSLQFQL